MKGKYWADNSGSETVQVQRAHCIFAKSAKEIVGSKIVLNLKLKNLQ